MVRNMRHSWLLSSRPRVHPLSLMTTQGLNLLNLKLLCQNFWLFQPTHNHQQIWSWIHLPVWTVRLLMRLPHLWATRLEYFTLFPYWWLNQMWMFLVWRSHPFFCNGSPFFNTRLVYFPGRKPRLFYSHAGTSPFRHSHFSNRSPTHRCDVFWCVYSANYALRASNSNSTRLLSSLWGKIYLFERGLLRSRGTNCFALESSAYQDIFHRNLVS